MASSDDEDYKHVETKDVSEESEEVERSDEEYEKKPAAKKQKAMAGQKRKAPSKSSADNSNVTELELSNKRRVFVQPFSSGDPSVHICEVYKDKVTQETRRGKGICLPMAQWKRLKELLPEIDEAIEKIQKQD